MNYHTDPRYEVIGNGSGLRVRVERITHDIATLTDDSLVAWLRSRGGENEFAEDVVMKLLAHFRNVLS